MNFNKVKLSIKFCLLHDVKIKTFRWDTHVFLLKFASDRGTKFKFFFLKSITKNKDMFHKILFQKEYFLNIMLNIKFLNTPKGEYF